MFTVDVWLHNPRRTPRAEAEIAIRKRDTILTTAERHLTAAEYIELAKEIDDASIDARIYDDMIIIMRDFRTPRG